MKDNKPSSGTGSETVHNKVTLFWNQRKNRLTVPLGTSNVARFHLAPGHAKFSAFCAEADVDYDKEHGDQITVESLQVVSDGEDEDVIVESGSDLNETDRCQPIEAKFDLNGPTTADMLRILRISPVGVVPQQARRPRLIVDCSCFDINRETLKISAERGHAVRQGSGADPSSNCGSGPGTRTSPAHQSQHRRRLLLSLAEPVRHAQAHGVDPFTEGRRRAPLGLPASAAHGLDRQVTSLFLCRDRDCY
jgi:hypothetical protein